MLLINYLIPKRELSEFCPSLGKLPCVASHVPGKKLWVRGAAVDGGLCLASRKDLHSLKKSGRRGNSAFFVHFFE